MTECRNGYHSCYTDPETKRPVIGSTCACGEVFIAEDGLGYSVAKPSGRCPICNEPLDDHVGLQVCVLKARAR